MTAQSPQRTFAIYASAILAVLIGLMALISSFVGLRGAGGFADNSLPVLNLIIGMTSVMGGLGYFLLKRWGLYFYGVSVLGHFVGHIYLSFSYAAIGRLTPLGVVQLSVVPLIALGVLISMVMHQRQGLLS